MRSRDLAARPLEKAGVTTPHPVALDLDGALVDTRVLWLDWLGSVSGLFGLDVETLPADRGEAATELDHRGAGNWRTLLERFGEERAPVYLRRDPAVSAALRALHASGREIGVFTDAPEALAVVALGQLGATRRVAVVETGSGAFDRFCDGSARRRSSCDSGPSCWSSPRRIASVDSKNVDDRQLDALLERLDRIAAELERLNRKTEQQEGFVLVARELRELSESLNALAYAALGQAPQVRRKSR